MDKFQAMQIFRAVADHGSFTVAARKLNISVSAATKNISGLETALGVQLLNRSTRRISLTDHGRDFHNYSVAILASLDEAESAIRERNRSTKGLVRIVMPYSFGRVTFTPELPVFFEQNPEISLDVHFSDEPINIIKEGFDLAVRSRELEDSRLIHRVLHKGPLITVAAPSYLQRHGVPNSPLDLKSHRCIVGNYGSDWRYRNPDGEPLKVSVNTSITLRNGDAVREAAVAGLGLAQSTWWLFRNDLREGRLVPVLKSYETDAVPISVCFPAKKNIPQRVSRVLDFLSDITSAKHTLRLHQAAAE